jgi:aminoglycoside phosphotransferase (APT) family kinase protein
LIRLGVLGRTGRERRLGPFLRQGPQNSTGKLEERVRVLESLLRIQKLHFQAQCEELATLRSQVKRVEQLQAELTVERESGERLVQWLQEAEQKLADGDARRLGGLNPLF